MSRRFHNLYSYDSMDRLRVWWMELDENKHRTVTGLQDGKKTESGWTICKAKNVGRANATTPEEQAESEIQSHYTKKKKQNWYETVEDAAKGSRFFEPMLAQKFEMKRIEKWPIFSQPKLDGIRCIAKHDGLWSRTGEPIVSCPHLVQELGIGVDFPLDLVLDGELYNHELKHDFNQITSIVKREKLKPEDLAKSQSIIQYHIYDQHWGYQPNATFEMRNRQLRAMMDDGFFGPSIRLVRTDELVTEAEIFSVMGVYLEQGYEGQMVRHGDTPYEIGKRSYSLMKNKQFEDDEFEIVSITEGKGNWSGKAKSVMVRRDSGIEFSCGIRGNENHLSDVLQNREKYIGKKAKVRFQGFTPDGKGRFAVVLELDRTW